jgi:hypothetical protein
MDGYFLGATAAKYSILSFYGRKEQYYVGDGFEFSIQR